MSGKSKQPSTPSRRDSGDSRRQQDSRKPLTEKREQQRTSGTGPRDKKGG